MVFFGVMVLGSPVPSIAYRRSVRPGGLEEVVALHRLRGHVEPGGRLLLAQASGDVETAGAVPACLEAVDVVALQAHQVHGTRRELLHAGATYAEAVLAGQVALPHHLEV